MWPFGRFTFDEASPAVTERTIFDVASLTKAIPASSLALWLIDHGKLRLDDSLATYIPEFTGRYRDGVTIKHLLTQTLEYTFRLSTLKDRSADDILNIIFTSGLKNEPGTTFCYTNATSILLGIVIERIMNEPLNALADRLFFAPLGMTRTRFHPLETFSKNEIVPTEIQEWRGGLVQGEVHDESAYVLQHKMIPGSAGLFSTAPDLLNFLEMLLHNGTIHSKQYLSKKIVSQIYANQLLDIGVSAGLGWELHQPQFMGSRSTPMAFGKTGFTGCMCIVDIPGEVACVMLANCTYPTRKPDASLINAIRRDIADAIFARKARIW